MTLQLAVNTGNIQVMTVASPEDRVLRTMVDLDRDYEHVHEEPTSTGHPTF